MPRKCLLIQNLPEKLKPWIFNESHIRTSEIMKSTKIAKDFGPSSRRVKGRILVVFGLLRKAEDGPKDKQDWIFIFFRSP